ncbi:MAG: rhodanese-like domain-containing protein [Thermoanaerobaculia bacterium]
MTVEELKARYDAGTTPVVLDVREPHELGIAKYPMEVVHIPLGKLPLRFGELPSGVEIVCACRSGSRSAHAVQFLKQQGFDQAVNLEGGILAWSARIDPSVPRY